jgi:death-on-curing protein
VKPKWVPKSVVLAIHDLQIAEHGGARGVLRDDRLESALAAPQQMLAYGAPDLCALAAKYAAALTRNHPFPDGNKRVAFVVAAVFLELNGLRLEASEADAATTMRALAAGAMDEAAYAQWLRDHAGRAPRRKRK